MNLSDLSEYLTEFTRRRDITRREKILFFRDLPCQRKRLWRV